MTYGVNLLLYLDELSQSQPDQMDGGAIEVLLEDEKGNEGSTQVDIAELAREAAKHIRALQSAANQTIGWVESTGALKEADNGEALRLLRDALSNSNPMPLIPVNKPTQGHSGDLLDSLLVAFDAKMDEEKGFRQEAGKNSTDWHYYNGRIDGIDAGRHLIEVVYNGQQSQSGDSEPEDFEEYCPGCNTQLNEENVGGYRCFCQQCVDSFPPFPAGSGGFSIKGTYPSFQWVQADAPTTAHDGIRYESDKQLQKGQQ